ncbi:MAG: pilus assembly protein TadG-related protein [Verrucomicrobiae bacterium]|nr:pilus assembly protein TadG-related protein [Verrucomicrobiae bacterium]
MKLFAILESRIRRLRDDQNGSVLLLSGIMAFMVAILGVFAVDTGQAIYNRIVAQNAADAAAETAALWQARGLNLVQQLNNFHYVFNVTLFGVEAGQLATCLSTPQTEANEHAACSIGALLSGGASCPPAIRAMTHACRECTKAGPNNDYQKSVAQQILAMQQSMTYTFPLLTLTYASQAAQQSGADDLSIVVPQYASKIGSQIGLSFPSLPAVNVFAFPINPASVSLNVQQVDGKYFPWRWSLVNLPSDDTRADEMVAKVAALVAWETGRIFCSTDPFQLGQFIGQFGGHDTPDDWGWRDKYYQGHPGYMTWAAGKTNQTELAGLGLLRWVNGGAPAAPVHYKFMNQDGLLMYVGTGLDSTSPLMVPPLIAVASSQVEGTGVIGKDGSLFKGFSSLGSLLTGINPVDQPPVDSTPHLISVYGVPFPSIYH